MPNACTSAARRCARPCASWNVTGLVEYVVRRGVVVRAFTIADVEEIYTIRNALEMLTLPAIVRNATAEDIPVAPCAAARNGRL